MLKILINPFEKYSEKQLFLFGLVFLFIGSYLGVLFNVQFDSILHVSFIEQVTFVNILIQNIIITILLALVLFVLGKYFNPKTRFIDVLNVSLISRIPFYLLTLINTNNLSLKLTEKLLGNLDSIENLRFTSFEISFLLITSFLVLCLLIWFAIFTWNGFKTATNAKTTKEVILFIITLIITNFISSYIIHLIN